MKAAGNGKSQERNPTSMCCSRNQYGTNLFGRFARQANTKSEFESDWSDGRCENVTHQVTRASTDSPTDDHTDHAQRTDAQTYPQTDFARVHLIMIRLTTRVPIVSLETWQQYLTNYRNQSYRVACTGECEHARVI
jgi:hypothetical protein